MRTLAALCFLIVLALPLTKAAPQTVDEFCADLSAVDSHLTLNFNAFFNVNLTTPYECVCNTTLLDTLVVDCLGMYDFADAFQTSREQAILKANNGTYTLIQAAWSDTFYDSINIFQGIYFFQDGELVSCEMTGCASCSICPDDSSIAVDCSTLAVGFRYTYACSNQYMGAFLSSFDFQIVQNPSEPPTAGPHPPAEPQTTEDFCADLSDLEAHMKSSFEAWVTVLPLDNNYGCECSSPADAAMLPDCTLRYGDDVCSTPENFALIIDCSLFYGGGDTFNFELAIFETSSNGTMLDLKRTGWGWGDTSIGNGFQEEFLFENGSLNECFVRSGAGVCTVCPDGESVSICSEVLEASCDFPCSEMYKGAFFNTYNFALLAAPTDTIPMLPNSSPTMAPTGSPLMATAPMDTMSLSSSPTAAPTSSGSPVMADATTASPTLAPSTALAAQGPTSGSSALQPVIGCLMLVATLILV